MLPGLIVKQQAGGGGREHIGMEGQRWKMRTGVCNACPLL